MKARNPRKGYVMKGQKAAELNVRLNMSHFELPFCSGVYFLLY
jgi:hypothetical protein